MNRYRYYPGCSVKGTARPYEKSTLAVFEKLGVEMEELKDWNCCGATAYMSIDEVESVALAGRNLALAEREGCDLVTPCSACYLVLNKAERTIKDNGDARRVVTRAMKKVGLEYGGSSIVKHVLDVIFNDVGLEKIASQISYKLDGLKVAPYYGCQIVRPYALFDSQDRPVTMDRLLEATGAKMVEYPFKTRCCGGSQTGTIPEVGLHLVYMLLAEARARGADVVATVCPLCQFNLDAYQDKIADKYDFEPVPVVYFTQILGLALGIPANRLGLQQSIVPAEHVLTRRTADVA